MAWTNPVFDRTQLDVTNRTKKGYFNIADWTRIYDNASFAKTLVETYFGITITFDIIAVPTVLTIPKVSDVNKLVGNINRIRTAATRALKYILYPLRQDWGIGNVPAPNYWDINSWEETLYKIVYSFSFRKPRSGIAICGTGLTRNNKFRRFS